MRRRTLVAAVLAAVTLAAAAGAARAVLTPAAYLARASAVCIGFARQLDHIPPPNDLTSFSEVSTAVGRALPVLRAQAAAVRAVPPPPVLAARVRALFVLVDRSNGLLATALAAAKRHDRPTMTRALGNWTAANYDAHAASVKLGLRCS